MAYVGNEAPKYYNEHNVFVRMGVATRKQLEDAVNAFKKILASNSDPKLAKLASGEIEINFVRDGSGNLKGQAYLFAQHPEVYWILCGYNPDGTPRVREVPSEETSDPVIDYADIDLSTIDFNTISEINRKNPPKIIEKLPPLITFPGFELTAEQRVLVRKYKEDAEEQKAKVENREPAPVTDELYGYFELDRAATMTLDESQNPNMLRGEVPRWVTPSMIYEKFAKFASGEVNSKYFLEKDKGVGSGPHAVPTEVYNFGTPFFKVKFVNSYVKFNPTYKVVLVEYPQSPNKPGIFAIQMRRQTVFNNPAPEKPEDAKAECVFTFYKNRDRTGVDSSSPSSKKSFGGFGKPSVDADGFAKVRR
jgi:hypothetical protein